MKKTIKQEDQRYEIPRMQVFEISARSCIAASWNNDSYGTDSGAYDDNEEYGEDGGLW